MPGDLEYTEEMYANAAQLLEVTEGSAQDRLIQAYVDHAAHAYPPGSGLGSEMPPELAERVEALHHRLTHDEAGVQQSPHSRIGAMSEGEINEAIEEILAIARDARQHRYPGT